jgi:hypothetical protein
MEPVGEHPVPVGPLAIRWLGYRLPELKAGTIGTARLRVENAGFARWRARGEAGALVSYHWLDDRGNAIVWDGIRTPIHRSVEPGETAELELALGVPQPPGRYRLAFDFLEEFRYWWSEVGVTPLELDVVVRPRIAERRLAVSVSGGPDERTTAALAAQEEPLVAEDTVATAYLAAGAVPAPDWSRRLLDAHAEGYAAVGGSIESPDRSLRPWAPGGGRKPTFQHPLLFPSLLAGLEPVEHAGLPAYEPGDETWIFDGRIRVQLPRGGRLRLPWPRGHGRP